jgi:hypothetical protein
LSASTTISAPVICFAIAILRLPFGSAPGAGNSRQ